MKISVIDLIKIGCLEMLTTPRLLSKSKSANSHVSVYVSCAATERRSRQGELFEQFSLRSRDLEEGGDGGAHHDSAKLPANRRKVHAIVLQQHAIRRLWVAGGLGVAAAALYGFSV